MKAVYAIPVATLALAVALVARAEPAAPVGGAAGTTHYNPKELQVDKIQSPRDPASGQATGIQSPRDATSGQAMGNGSNNRSVNPSQPDNFSLSSSTPGSTLVNNENVTSARGTETAQPGQFMSGAGGDGTGIRREQPGSGANAPCLSECQKQIDWVRANPEAGSKGQFVSGSGGDGTGIRKPRPNNRPRKGKRQHKP